MQMDSDGAFIANKLHRSAKFCTVMLLYNHHRLLMMWLCHHRSKYEAACTEMPDYCQVIYA
jgi:hypothetical protein